MNKMKHSCHKIGSENPSTSEENQLLKVHDIERMEMTQSNVKMEKVQCIRNL